VLLAMPIGILIGLSLGALGGGGSILTVPALVYLLGLSLRSATTTSLIIVGITSIAGATVHMRAGRVRLRAGIVFGVLGAGGAFAGSRLSAAINPDILLTAFSGLMAAAAVTMLLRHRPGSRRGPGPAAGPGPADVRLAGPEPGGLQPVAAGAGPGGASGTGAATCQAPARVGPRERRATPTPARVVLAATAVGLVTGFFGVGGGFVVVPALVLALGFDMPTAVGTSLFVIAINSASSLLSRVGTHATINPGLLGTFSAAAIAGALVGTRVTSKVRPERLAGAFAILTVAVALYTAARSVPALI
jgi:uncharacterized membrane protein YfcA